MEINAEMQALSVIDREDASKLEVRPPSHGALAQSLEAAPSHSTLTSRSHHASPCAPPPLCRGQVVRALLVRPDALLLHRISDAWAVHEQKQLITVLREYLANGTGRSVILCTSDTGLALSLRSDDLLLSIDSESKMTLQTVKGSGIMVQRMRMVEGWKDAIYTEYTRMTASALEEKGVSRVNRL